MYARDRALVVNAAAEKEVAVKRTAFPYQERGPQGEVLTTEFVSLPAPCAETALVIISGTHGIEGPAGALVQYTLLNNLRTGRWHPAPGIELSVVFALNPWGYACGRRVDASNIDVNRACGLPLETDTQSQYERFREVLEPAKWDAKARRAVSAAMASDPRGVQAAATGGQYHSPRGLFYGGAGTCASGIALREISKKIAERQPRRVAVLDIHTGLGAHAAGELISPETQPGRAAAVARRIPGVRFPNMSDGVTQSVSSPVSGDALSAMQRWIEGACGAEVLGVALEVGAGVPVAASLPLLIAENAVWQNPAAHGARAANAVRRKFREVFWRPDDLFWKGALWGHAQRAIETLEVYLTER